MPQYDEQDPQYGAYARGGSAYGSAYRPKPPHRLTIPAWTPDYTSIIKGSPEYMAHRADWDKRLGHASADRREQLRALILQFGGIGGVADRFGDLDPELLALAQQNQNSQLSQLNKAYGQQVHDRHNSLVSRGMEGSGESGFQDSQAAQWRSGEEYNLGQALLQAAKGVYGDYTGATDAIGTEETSYLNDPTLRQSIAEANPGIPESTAALVPGSEGQYGTPVYKTPSGKLYIMGPNGQPQEIDPKANRRSEHKIGRAFLRAARRGY